MAATGTLRDLSERLWQGDGAGAGGRAAAPHPLFGAVGMALEEYRPGLSFVASFGNVTALDTPDGLALIDVGGPMAAAHIHGAVRGWSQRALRKVVYTHGHVDHVMGISAFAGEPGPAPHVIAHCDVPARFDRYKLTAGWNGAINARQFGLPGFTWPTDYRYPDEVYRDHLTLEFGGIRAELHHARGETDDHTWVWLPDHKTVVTGDLFIWAVPNCGNPQKVQRYPREWAIALRTMAALGAELLLPGHGPPIEGAARVHQALTETAALLESLHEQVLAQMNAGASLDTVLAEVRAPAALLERPYLRPVYDDPTFIVRALWRLYGGWWDGDPAHLKPPGERALAAEVASLAGGAGALIDRALAVADSDLALACQLAEWAHAAAPGDAAIRKQRAELYTRRAAGEPSLMAKAIFTAASR